VKRISIRATWAHVLAALAVCAALGWPAYAVVTASWEVDSYRDFDKGEAKAAFITSLGEVKPGWDTRRTDLELDGVWAMVRAADGTLLLGTDDKGTIYAVRGAKVTPVVSIEDAIAVVSLALADDGTLYAGTMPGGQVFKVDVAAGTASRLAELPDVETVWALALAAGGEALYAGTGPDGKLFRIDAKTGRHSVAFDADDKRILSLVATRDGAIWMGTSDRALVYRHDPATRRTRAMADFAGNEITALAELDGGVVVAANEFAEPTTTGVKTRAAVDKAAKQPREGHKPTMPAADSAPGADKPAPSGSEPPRKGERKG
jgi:outer membrane protein assembly factor BamB